MGRKHFHVRVLFLNGAATSSSSQQALSILYIGWKRTLAWHSSRLYIDLCISYAIIEI